MPEPHTLHARAYSWQDCASGPPGWPVRTFLDQFQVWHAQVFASQGHSDDVAPNLIRAMASGAHGDRKFVTARFDLTEVLDAIQPSGKRTARSC